MSNPQELAKGARQILAEALQAMQSGADVPEQLLSIAEPIAHTMGVLLAIERSGGTNLEGRQEALDSVRKALDDLQAVDSSHPSVDKATEAVAGSLSKLFALSRAKLPEGTAAAPAAPAQPSAQPMAATQALPPQPVAPTQALPAQPGVQPVAAAAPAPSPLGATAMAGTPAAVVAPGAAMPGAPGAAMPAAPMDPEQARLLAEAEAAQRALAEAQAKAAEAARIAQAKAAEAAHIAAEEQRRAAEQAAQQAKVFHQVPGMTDAPPPPEGLQRVNVELGAHSPSNFYKGLSGNDVVDHGGIFVATYSIPKAGTAIALRVLLPGDLEFEADVLVQWVRETRSGEEQPGFGAKFTRISGEGRQLVYRYARNREPMFYDDF